MTAIKKSTLTFLKRLKKNNDRDWFTANKKQYESARSNFEDFVAELIMEIAKFDAPVADLNPKKSIFRIYRDTRFSKDKTPYKLHFGAHLVAGAEKPHDRAGYYIHIEPGASILAGGAYMPPSPWIKAIRSDIDAHAADLKKIIADKTFQKYFGGITGEKLKSAPRDYAKDHPEIELLKYKSFLAVHKVPDNTVLEDNFVTYCGNIFNALNPFDDFLNRSKGL